VSRRLRRCLALAVASFALDAAVASTWLAADAPADQVARARAYEHGEGVAKDLPKAIALYCEAARLGDLEAQFRLGWIYANGRGVARDDALAASLFRLAMAGGHEGAKRALLIVRAPGDELPACMQPPPMDPTLFEALGPEDDGEFTPAAFPLWQRRIAEAVAKQAPRYSVHPRLALAVIAVESNFDPAARSPKDAQGLMQLMPDTAVRFGVRNRYDVNDNLRGGLAYLQWLLSYYRGNVLLAVAAYNAGEGTVDRYGGIPPYPETRSYVQRIRALYPRERHPYDPAIADPSPLIDSVGLVGFR
jgi:TPR repeat protein